MARYRVCKTHGLYEVDESNKCPKCPQEDSKGVCAVYHSFPEGEFEHITEKPLYISDRRQLKDACKEHGVISPFYS